MLTLPSGSIDLVLADLPYGTTQNRWDSAIPLQPLWEAYLRVCKKTAAIVLTSSQPFTSVLVTSKRELFRHEWIWIKNRGSNFANTVREPFKEHETVLVFSRGGWTYNKQMQSRTGGGASRVAYEFNFKTETDNYGVFVGKESAKLPSL
jgi:site-specific DNA-methyltransferase (adenine-specific)